MSAAPSPWRHVHLAGCGWFWAWAGVGFATALAAVVLGLLALPVAAVAFWMARQPAIRRSAFGFVAGIGALMLFVAYLQRTGEHHLDPVPWLVVGLTLLVTGGVGHARLSRRHG